MINECTIESRFIQVHVTFNYHVQPKPYEKRINKKRTHAFYFYNRIEFKRFRSIKTLKGEVKDDYGPLPGTTERSTTEHSVPSFSKNLTQIKKTC